MMTPASTGHRAIELDMPYRRFADNLEALLGHLNPEVLAGLQADPESTVGQIRQMEGEQGLMLFAVYDHGSLLRMHGVSQQAKTYVLGNPLIASTMTRHDVRAALYVPLRVLVYASVSGNAVVEFDQPSSLLGQFENVEVNEVARGLDRKLDALISKAGELRQ
jgi:uncharacterized protein (DUF302 family)